MNGLNQRHWDNIFSSKNDDELGWYESDINQTLKFIDAKKLGRSQTVMITGAGTSLLVDRLLESDSQLILNDISQEAIDKLKVRIGDRPDRDLIWFHHDLSKVFPAGIPQVNLWIDRAVLHFLTEERDINIYFANLKSHLTQNGRALFAEFSLTGALKCAGLDVHRYSVTELASRLGEEFKLVESENYTFINPFGNSRPYIYALFEHK